MTARQRQSLISLALPFGRVLPAPDGDPTVEDRLHWLYLYRMPVPLALSATLTSDASLTGDLLVMAHLAATLASDAALTGDLVVTAHLSATLTSDALLTGDLELVLPPPPQKLITLIGGDGHLIASLSGGDGLVTTLAGGDGRHVATLAGGEGRVLALSGGDGRVIETGG